MAGDEYILSFWFAIQLQFQLMNNAEQQNKQLAFVSLISAAAPGRRNTEYRHIANALTLAAILSGHSLRK